MTEEISLQEYKKAYMEVAIEEEKKVFLVFLAIYALVNSMFIAINLLYTPEYIWFFYPLIGWGSTTILMHYVFGVRRAEKWLKEREAKAEHKVREAKRTKR